MTTSVIYTYTLYVRGLRLRVIADLRVIQATSFLQEDSEQLAAAELSTRSAVNCKVPTK
jgi:hypothetical protein